MTYRQPTRAYVSSMTDGTATVAKIVLETDEFEFRGSGSSRRMTGDANDAELGELLAVQRALEIILESMQAKTSRLIAVNDKKKKEAENWRSKEDWEDFQRQQAMDAHPAGRGTNPSKRLKVVK